MLLERAPGLPLLPMGRDGPAVAWRDGRPLPASAFLAAVEALAARLPEADYVLNLCKDRVEFAAGWLAAVARGRPTLLPSSSAPEGLARLCAAHPGTLCLGSVPAPAGALADTLSPAPFLDAAAAGPGASACPSVPFDRLAALIFTSGTTGEPQAHAKTFGRLRLVADACAHRLWPVAGGACSVVATVPSQHMFGLEAGILLPLLGGGCLSPRLPYFPAEIAAALAEMPAPRLLVTTPFHLRVLLDSGVALPALGAVLSATATLPQGLADETERRLGAPLMEIFGSTETGQLAMRRPSRCAEWELYPGIELTLAADVATVRGGHLERPYVLNDLLEPAGARRFRLLGRHGDMVNVAGKRNSLANLNHILTGLPGVADGVFCRPPDAGAGEIERLFAFVVAPGMDRRQLRAALRAHIDPVFLPRPLVLLDALPRNAAGKLTAAALDELVARHLPRGAGRVARKT
jgi:acyl-coenzyme A synthetase/AMP-(fatty) acid ligase